MLLVEPLLQRVQLAVAGQPSMVVISAPSACTASRVHDLTARPFTMIVQAPQPLVSQPT